jgi:hypothetical protein
VKPLAISERLKILLTDAGQPVVVSSYGYNPLQIEGAVLKWQGENPDHPRFRDAVSWLGSYQEQVQAFKRRLRLDRYQASLGKQKEKAARFIESVMKLGLSRETAESASGAALFYQISSEVKELGSSDEESRALAISIVKGWLNDLGCSDEQAANRLIAILKFAENL